MNDEKQNILVRLIKLTKIIIYIIIFIISLIYLLTILLKHYTSLKIKWKVSLYRTRKMLSNAGLDKAEVDEIAKDIIGRPPSIRDLYRMFRAGIYYE